MLMLVMSGGFYVASPAIAQVNLLRILAACQADQIIHKALNRVDLAHWERPTGCGNH